MNIKSHDGRVLLVHSQAQNSPHGFTGSEQPAADVRINFIYSNSGMIWGFEAIFVNVFEASFVSRDLNVNMTVKSFQQERVVRNNPPVVNGDTVPRT
jgi:hypothetical protein